MNKEITVDETAISDARLRVDSFRHEFEERKKIEYQEASALVRLNLYQTIWNARDKGVPVSRIAQAYGTTDRATIYTIIAKRQTLAYVAPLVGSRLTLVSNPEAHAKGGYPDDWSAWTVTVQSWDDFTRPDALTALEKTDSESYSGWLTFCVRPNASIHIIEAEHPGSPLHKEVIAWQEDSPLVQQIKTQMEVEK